MRRLTGHDIGKHTIRGQAPCILGWVYRLFKEDEQPRIMRELVRSAPQYIPPHEPGFKRHGSDLVTLAEFNDTPSRSPGTVARVWNETMKRLAVLSALLFCAPCYGAVTVETDKPGTVYVNQWKVTFGEGGGKAIAAGAALKVVEGGQPTPPDDPPDPPAPTGFKGKIRAALSQVPEDHRDVKGRLASNYESIASEAAANPGQWSPADLHDQVKVRHARVLTVAGSRSWAVFFRAAAKALREENLPDELSSHVQAFHTIASVLKE